MLWKGSVTRRGEKRRRILLKSGCQEINISLITELEFELDVERINCVENVQINLKILKRRKRNCSLC